jgi:acyl-CoA synthetase (AMP-forming)/AMP-acid ligase II
MNTADYLLEACEDQEVALLAGRKSWTYQDLICACSRLLGEYLSKGVAPGDRVGILGENSIFWAASYLSALKLSAVAVPFPTVSTPEDFSRNADFMDCRLICVDQKAFRKFSPAFRQGQSIICEDVLLQSGPSTWEPVCPDFDLDQDAALMLTSGTTSRPRAVRVTHRNIQANTDSIIEYLDLDHNDRILSILPFYYCFGTSLLHTHLRAGGSLALCNTFAYPETALDMIDATHSTGFAGVPSTYQTLLRNTSFPKRGLESLKKVQQAGGKLSVVFIQELREALPEAQIFVMYGQTEATARLSYLPPALLDEKLGSIGKGIPGVELRVVDEQGDPVKPGEVGEIIASGENISPGYYNNPEATAEKFKNGMLKTGDLAKVDEDGFIYIVDRKSDFIKSLGHRVSSQEIEARILQLPEVVSAAAIGVPDDLQGEAIRVFVTLKTKAKLTPDEIILHCKQTLARHMVPRDVIVIDRLPMNAHGKVIKSQLREWDSVKV